MDRALGYSKLFIFIFVNLWKNRKINGNNFCKECCKKLWKKNNTKNIRRLVNESFVPANQQTSKPAYYIVDCRIFGSAAIFIVSTLISKVPSSEFVLLSRIFISGKELTVFTLCDDKARIELLSKERHRNILVYVLTQIPILKNLVEIFFELSKNYTHRQV